jgi:hypothetical protein
MSRVFVATAMSSSFVGTLHSREELDALVDRLTTSGSDRGDISLMASHDAVIRKLRAVYRDPVEIAEAPGLPRRDLVTRDDFSSVSAVVFGTLVSALGAALPVIAPGGAPGRHRRRGPDWRRSGDGHRQSDQAARRGPPRERPVARRARRIRSRARSRARGRGMAIMRDCGAGNVHVHEVRMKRFEDAPL